MQRKRHLQILKMLKRARQNYFVVPFEFESQPSLTSINKALHDLEHAAFKNRAMLQARSKATNDNIKQFIKG